MNRICRGPFCSMMLLFLAIVFAPPLFSDTPSIANDLVECRIVVKDGLLLSDRLAAQPQWEKFLGHRIKPVETDADFSLEIMWTDWQAPLTINNAENPLVLHKSHFTVVRQLAAEDVQGIKELRLVLRGRDVPLTVLVTYQLSPKEAFVRKSITVTDSSNAGHFLQYVAPLNALLSGTLSIIKSGGFGQPVAVAFKESGAFFGVEYPAADNRIAAAGRGFRLCCGNEVGVTITSAGTAGESVVIGLTPDTHVKLWFMEYVNSIRVAPLRPYTLYNSWYDLRSAEYPRVPSDNIMNEEHVLRIAKLMRENMIEKYGIPLDAFVLDDGWDVYESDWALRSAQFPHGLKPVADELKKTGTALGLWFGPTGGYSFRMKRINWMKAHGYEVVGSTPNTAMLCLAGARYDSLFSRRMLDFVTNDGAGYFKWDGIQFSCSEPDHGHPVGIFSRHAVMESVAELCRSVRSKNPSVFLNITSGTWLSPWWVKYANQIWMQGEDYGYADVPSISPRDAAITYRDLSLYEDFRKNDFWFPIQNLMTHGIIKGTLQKLGGEAEPLDKFADEVMLYLSRGVSMWEMYISPDLLSAGEWDVMGSSMRWARDRFPVLSTTEMVGGDPKKREAYGYVHFAKQHAVLAVRNPWIEETTIRVRLDPSQGLDKDASALVLERVYPTRWISPRLYGAGETVILPLGGYETAVYEMYPLAEAKEPLLAGVTFTTTSRETTREELIVQSAGKNAVLLNPEIAGADLSALRKVSGGISEPILKQNLTFAAAKTRSEMSIQYRTETGVTSVKLAVLVSSPSPKNPRIMVETGGIVDTALTEGAAGASRWYTVSLPLGRHRSVIHIIASEKQWSGNASLWLLCRQKSVGVPVSITARRDFMVRPMPPCPMKGAVVEKNIFVGEWRSPEL